jgi:uncharacterized HAD superfamily protein
MTETDVHCFDLGLVLGISNEELNKLVRETLQKNLALNIDARESLNKLYLATHRVVLLTARSPDLGKVTTDWLEGKHIPYSELIHLDEGKKHLAEVSLDLVVEDNLENAIGWSEKVRNVLIYDHPWNQSLDVKCLFKRVHNWNEIMKEIEELR